MRFKENDKGRSRAFGRNWVREGFRRFGEHCARNQVSLCREKS
jgi:hypothetical protein